MKTNKLTKLKQPDFPAKNERAIKEVLSLMESDVDSLKYTKKTGKITAIFNHDGVISTINRQVCTIGDITLGTNTNVTDKQARNQYIVSLRKQGYSQTNIANIVGLSQSMIHIILSDAGEL
mgnify:CR=1 FL=1